VRLVGYFDVYIYITMHGSEKVKSETNLLLKS